MLTSSTPVFVDCDNTLGLPRSEIDDGLVILYLLAQPSVRIVGISTTFGNGPIDAVTRQTRALVRALDVPIPVFRGAAGPAATSRVGGAPPPSVPEGRPPREAGPPSTPGDGRSAARALALAAREHEGRLVVLGLGAATNLAAAEELDPGFFHRLAGIYLMGGYLAPLRFRSREVEELNFSADPQAAWRVLTAPCLVTVMSAQLCLAAKFGMRNLIAHNRGPRGLRRIVQRWYVEFSRFVGESGFYLWDLVPAVAVVTPARVPASYRRLRSGVDELRVGRLALDVVDPHDAGADPSEPGVISVPERIRNRRRFAGDCAAAWSRAAAGHDFRAVFVRRRMRYK